MISIITRTHDRKGKLLRRCIPSVLAQTCMDWQLIVVGDGATQPVVDAMRTLTHDDRRIQFWNVDRPEYPADPLQRWHVQGVHAVNFGIAKAHGDWVLFLDDDDELLPHALCVLMAFQAHDDADVVYARSETFKRGKATGQLYGAWPPQYGQPAVGAYLYRKALDLNWRWTLDTPADADFWQRLVATGSKFAFVPAVIHRYHRAYP